VEELDHDPDDKPEEIDEEEEKRRDREAYFAEKAKEKYYHDKYGD
jgi:hypothetical protein